MGAFELTKLATKLILSEFASFNEDLVSGISDSKVFVWILGIIFALILIIIMLNLLISFINDSYERFTNFQKTVFLFEKIGLIGDYDRTMNL